MSTCARPGCVTLAKSSCSGCGREQYCGNNCQKLDWKIHKPICPILKTLLHRLQPFHEVVRIIKEIGSAKGTNVRILEHLLSYAEHQFGKEIPGLGYRKRKDGERISNFEVDIDLLNYIYTLLASNYDQSSSFSTIICHDMCFFYLGRSISLLNPWLNRLDTNAGNRNDEQIRPNSLLHRLFCNKIWQLGL
jgi:hypothetical protein